MKHRIVVTMALFFADLQKRITAVDSTTTAVHGVFEDLLLFEDLLFLCDLFFESQMSQYMSRT